MSDVMAEILSILPNAEKQGVLTNNEKNSIKEILFDEGNIIVGDIVEEYKNTKNQSELLAQLKQYIHDIESDGEEVNYDDIGASPTMIVGVPPKKQKNKSTKQVVQEQIGISECEEGMSPKVVF